ncbi:MAG: dihydrodipicolinate synthase family protein, partial [Eubacteriales bacterium]|nr:dihydrodipicolinate synthase family protein [Eubacteriales bacterium]
MKTTLNSFTGVIPALMTPFDKKGEYDRNCAKQMLDWVIVQGIGGLYLTGSNGHGPFMESNERMKVVESIVELVDGRVPVVAHIASVSSKISAKMARHAAKCGCTGVSAVPSYYYKLTPKQMYDYYDEIAAASDLPFLVYAQTSNYEPSVEMFQKLALIENIKGVKFTGSDHYMLGRIKEHLGKSFLVYSGRDEKLLSGLISGADGVIGGSYNVIPDLCIRCINKFWSGKIKEAQKDMLAANAILEIMLKYEFSSAMRA